MLRAELNERITQVGPGTPGGKLLRHYWFPIAGEAEITRAKPTKRVRILGEDLVLYRDASGNYGLIEERCAHRRISLYYGIPEPEGIRCPYHGWLYDLTGQCIEQPAEPEGSTFKDKVKLTAYPVQVMGGLLFAYLGEQPAPLLPRYDLFVLDDLVRQIGFTVIPCNWVQAMENSLDQTHVEWLHGYYSNYLGELQAEAEGREHQARPHRKHVRLGWDRFEHGIIKRRVEEGGSEEDDDWQIGHPVVFPYILKTGSAYAPSFQIRVPMDDFNTLHILYRTYRPGVEVPKQDPVPVYQLPWQEENGDAVVSYTLAQDMMAWVTQGDIAERQSEKLGAADTGIILYRDMLLEQIDTAERGEDPMEVYRDPATNAYIDLPQEKVKHGDYAFNNRVQRRGGDTLSRHMPPPDYIFDLYEEAKRREAAGEPLLQTAVATLGKPTDAKREVALKK